LLAGILSAALPGPAAAAPLAVSTVEYRLDARLDPAARTVTGSAVVRWRNTTRKPTSELYLHLYLNAFESNRTTLMTEMRGDADRWQSRYPDEWGRIDLASLRIGDRDVSGQLEFVRPDDGNPHDRTLARLPLAKPVAPKESLELQFDFVARLPRLFMRAGHAAPFFFVAQWFPKLAVLRDGAWRAHQYHAASEFFADFGSYDVSLTVPSNYVVGHTGELRAERDNGDGSKTLEVRAEDVHDFAWTADPRFVVREETIAGVRVRLLVQPHHRAQSDRYLDALRAAMVRYAEWFAAYPYPVLTVVDPGPGGLAAAGMEYPMLITVGTTWWMPAGLRFPEIVTIHEFGHQYWYGMVANDEVNEAWLDEGINSYVEEVIMDEAYAPGSYIDLFGLRVDSVPLARFQYLAAGCWDPITRPSYRMLDRDSYQSTSYAKTALVLRSLGRLYGEERLRAALRDYLLAWRFRHPTGADFRRSLVASLTADPSPAGGGEDERRATSDERRVAREDQRRATSDERPLFDALLEQLLDSPAILDYAVARVDVREVPPLRPSAVAGAMPTAEAPRYRTEVVVERRGEVRLPVEVLVVFEDGSETRATWDGSDRWHRLDITGTEAAAYAVVDPDQKLPLDANRLNNSRMRTAGTRGVIRLAGRWGVWLERALLALSGL
jgi:hypothetical protein